ncbi:beta-N-acetylglucosaminidase domain-containing protein [Paenarthrobacter sp. NPDC058040]|uniref:beta-N-acetylhexosaminidase family protein n=1 Tax=unclassified Paenarthrobacter TaxID=2634190 RepID=UPI0036D7A994
MSAAPVRPGAKRRRRTLLLSAAAILVAALVAGWIIASKDRGPAPGGHPAGLPGIFPVPQRASVGSGPSVPLNGRVYIVAPPGTDQPSLAAVQDLVKATGGTGEVVATVENPVDGSSAIYLGTAEGSPAGTVLKDLGPDSAGSSQEALKHAEGYAIATGTSSGIPTAVLAGSDGDGVFHAVQTLRQAVKDGSVPPIRVSDWPLMETRGVIEGFYGTPWSHQARLDVIEFAARQKMNTYIYSPKDDPLLRDKWRALYSDQELRELQELIDTAAANHIRFTYALSPGVDVCYSRDSDLDDAITKLDSLYSLGVRSFVIPLDDIATKVQCSEDVKEFGSGQANLAKAQASFLNELNLRFTAGKQGLQPLETVPTFYNGSGSTPYKKELGRSLDPAIVVQWTGEDVVSHRITRNSAETARRSYGTSATPRDIVIWDNYPVNDFSQDHLFLAPLIGRDADLYQSIRGVVTNPMIEPYLSLPAIFNYADFAWNGPAYNPQNSMDAALAQVSGPDPEVQAAVKGFADLNQDWQDDELTPSAPALRRDIDQFWSEYDAGKSPSGALLARAGLLQRLPELLPKMAVPGFATDATHWASAAAEYGHGVAAALAMLDADRKGNSAAAAESRRTAQAALAAAAAKTQPTLDLGVVTPVLGDSELKTFLERALQTVPPN